MIDPNTPQAMEKDALTDEQLVRENFLEIFIVIDYAQLAVNICTRVYTCVYMRVYVWDNMYTCVFLCLWEI